MFFAKMLLPFSMLVACAKAKQTQVESTVEGDQTVGGIHLFEVHAPGGGIGIGIKVLIVLAIIGGLVYWYIRRKANKLRRQLNLVNPIIGAAATATHTYPQPSLHRPQAPPQCPCHNREPEDFFERPERSGTRLP